jgi:hypothetical protein
MKTNKRETERLTEKQIKEIILRLRKESSKTDTETDRMKTNKRQTERWTETQIKERVNYREGKGGTPKITFKLSIMRKQ